VSALTIFALVVCALYALMVSTWKDYLAVLHLMEHKQSLTGAAKFFGYQVAALGIARDFLVNMIIGTIFFLELPHELLFTHRCDRWLGSATWRGRLARFFCSQLLDPFGINGEHCKAKTTDG
jgi:hypothetical protein